MSMKGMMCVIVTPEGDVAAAEADFNPSSPAGFSAEHMQARRAQERAWRTVMREFCHQDIATAIDKDPMLLPRIARGLEDAGWKEHSQDVETP